MENQVALDRQIDKVLIKAEYPIERLKIKIGLGQIIAQEAPFVLDLLIVEGQIDQEFLPG